MLEFLKRGENKKSIEGKEEGGVNSLLGSKCIFIAFRINLTACHDSCLIVMSWEVPSVMVRRLFYSLKSKWKTD